MGEAQGLGAGGQRAVRAADAFLSPPSWDCLNPALTPLPELKLA